MQPLAGSNWDFPMEFLLPSLGFGWPSRGFDLHTAQLRDLEEHVTRRIVENGAARADARAEALSVSEDEWSAGRLLDSLIPGLHVRSLFGTGALGAVGLILPIDIGRFHVRRHTARELVRRGQMVTQPPVVVSEKSCRPNSDGLAEQVHGTLQRSAELATSFAIASEKRAAVHVTSVLSVLKEAAIRDAAAKHPVESLESIIERQLSIAARLLSHLEAFESKRMRDYEWQRALLGFGLISKLLALLDEAHSSTSSTRRDRVKSCGDGQGFEVELSPKESRAGPDDEDDEIPWPAGVS